MFSRGVSAEDYPSLWIHVDAAWAGMALACPEYRELAGLDAINKYAFSFCTNFHKVLMLSSLSRISLTSCNLEVGSNQF
jgi:hypothetical protein